MIGETIEGRYEVLEELGRGGFGVVYKAKQLATGQLVALKILLSEKLTHSPEVAAREAARFEREMQLIGQLKHPHITGLIDSGQLEQGQLFMVLEFIRGQPLSSLLDGDTSLPLEQAVRLMTQVLEALAHAHAHGVVHRDLKPHNIMVTDPGPRCNASVLDFGIAGISEEARGQDYRTLTASGQIQGTPAYMSPEQLSGETPTPGFDLYAWGLVFYECLSGNVAVTGENLLSVMSKQIAPTPVELEEPWISSPLGPILRRASEKNPSARYARCEDALDALSQLDLGRVREYVANAPMGGLKAQAMDDTVDARVEDVEAATTLATKDAEDDRQRTLMMVGGSVLGAILLIAIVIVSLGGGEDTAEPQKPQPGPSSSSGAQVAPTADATDDTTRVAATADVERPEASDVLDVKASAAQREACGRYDVEACRVLCEATPPDLDACVRRAEAFGYNINQADDYPEVARLAELACDGGQMDGCALSSILHLSGDGVERSIASTISGAASKSCEGESAKGCALLALYTKLGISFQQNPRRARQLIAEARSPLEAACGEGDLVACIYLGELLNDFESGITDHTRALRYFSEACEAGAGEACRRVGEMYRDGVGVEMNAEKAFKVFSDRCAKGELYSCLEEANALDVGRGATLDRERALTLFERVCDGSISLGCSALGASLAMHGDDEGKARGINVLRDVCKRTPIRCDVLSWLTRDGRGVSPDLVLARELAQKACDAGNGNSCAALAWMYLHASGGERDAIRASSLHRRACDAGTQAGCLGLGWMTLQGDGIEQNIPRGIELLEGACDKLEAEACQVLGQIYLEGDHIKKDVFKGLLLLNKGCDMGASFVCNDLGLIFEDGKGVDVDLERARQLYQKACNIGNISGCNNLAVIFHDGRGVEADPTRARQLYEKACAENGESRIATSCYGLALLYESGNGVEADLATAMRYYALGCDGELKDSCEAFTRLSTPTPDAPPEPDPDPDPEQPDEP